MNILFISINRSALPTPVMPVGVCLVAEAVERAGHTVHFVDAMFAKDPLCAIEAALVSAIPDVIGLSVRNIDNNDMQAPEFFLDDLLLAVNAIRAHTDAPIILGGAAFGVMPEQILRMTGLACGVTGAGEAVFPLLLERIAGNRPFGDLPGTAVIERGVFHKNSPRESPERDVCSVPDYRTWVEVRTYRRHMATAPVRTKIGCRFKCVYCTYRMIEGSARRQSEPGYVADAVSRLAASGLCDIEFVDSVFNDPYEHAMAVCEALSRVKHRARLQSMELTPLHFDDALARAMHRAGFAGIGITVESASDAVLHGLQKGFFARDVHRAAEVVNRNELPCAWIFLLGGPGETQDTVRATLRFAEEHIRPIDAAFFNVGIRIYPGTELEAIARKEGSLSLPAKDMLRPVFYVSPEVEGRWIIREVKQSMSSHMNFINADTINLPYLPAVHRMGHRLGLRPPLWRHTRVIRRGLRLVGMDA